MESHAALHAEPSLDDVLDDPDRWIDAARNGNGRASVALFRIAVAAANPRSDLGTLPSELTRRPLTWLELGADRGDPEAQVLYALNADRHRAPTTTADAAPDELVDVRAKSLRYLEAAASAGLEEAFGVLATGYQSGRFGERDAISSAAYLLALAQLDPLVSHRRHAEQHIAALDTSDRERAGLRAMEIVERVRRS